MALRNKQPSNRAAQIGDHEKQELIRALRGLKPQTKMGRRLVALSLQGVRAGVTPLSTEEILASLGRYENDDRRT